MKSAEFICLLLLVLGIAFRVQGDEQGKTVQREQIAPSPECDWVAAKLREVQPKVKHER